MKATIALIAALISVQSFSSSFCQKNFSDSIHDFEVLRESKDKTFLLENWDNMPNIKEFEREYCEELVDMELVKVKNRFFWVFRSKDDPCDGGNTYGAIYNYSLTKPVATINDGDVGCL